MSMLILMSDDIGESALLPDSYPTLLVQSIDKIEESCCRLICNVYRYIYVL
jgi:hypothetical protein